MTDNRLLKSVLFGSWKEYNAEEDSQSDGWTTSQSGLVWV